MTNRAWLFVLVMISLSACRQSTPVQEVSVAESGVKVTEATGHNLESQWPMWRGPRLNGHVPAQDLPTQWDDSSNIRWRASVQGRGHGSPTVVGDLVFLATANDASQQQSVFAYDRRTGAKRWDTLIHEGGFPAASQLHKKGTNANSTVACDGERIYIAFLNSDKIFVTALDLRGQEVWQRDIGAFNSKFGYAPSPVLVKSLVVVAADNYGGGYIAALDGKTGEVAWRVARSSTATYSSPGIANLGGKQQLLISGDNRVASYDPATGETIWSTTCGSEATCGTVVATENRVFASGGYPQRETVCLSATGEVLWTNKTKVYEPSLLVAGDQLFAVSDDGVAYCWSIADGKVFWRERLGGSFSASPILCNGLIYVTNLSGVTFVFQATAAGYERVAVNKLGDDCYASPAVVDEELFMRIGIGSGSDRQEELVCIGRPGERGDDEATLGE